MRKVIVVAALVVVLANGPAWGKNIVYTGYGTLTCGQYLDGYSRMEFTTDGQIKGKFLSHQIAGYVSGYLTAYNSHALTKGKTILGSMTRNDSLKWLASWCRDNMHNGLPSALDALIRTLKSKKPQFTLTPVPQITIP